MRMIDYLCPACETRIADVMCADDDTRCCPTCNTPMQQDWLPRVKRRDAQWDDHAAVVIYRNHATGKLEYPGMNNRPTPPGRERITLRSLREVEKFERDNHVVNEAMHYDNGSGTLRPDDTYRGQRLTH